MQVTRSGLVIGPIPVALLCLVYVLHLPKSGWQSRLVSCICILVPRGRDPFDQLRGSRPLARSNSGSPHFTDFPSLCACSEPSPTNVIGSGLNLLCFQSHSKPECRWTWPEVAIPVTDQKDRGSGDENGHGNTEQPLYWTKAPIFDY